jgi:hypothetical protein
MYGRLAEQEWAHIPALSPGRDDPHKYGKRFRITHIVETLARQTGNVENGRRREEAGSLFALFVLADCRDLQASGPTRSCPRLGRAWSQSIPPATRFTTSGVPYHSQLVRIFLWEKKFEAAWNEATSGGCSNNLWLELAAKREQKHPEDALEILQTTGRTHGSAHEQ